MVVAARYVNRELFLVLLAVTAVLLVVTVGGRFISYLQDAALGKYAADSIGTILWFRLPGFLQLLLPFAWFLALLLTLGRLHAEQEFEVLRGGGVGPAQLLRWLMPLAFCVAGVVGYFSLWLAPDNDRRLTEFIQAERENAEFGGVTPGVFHTLNRGSRVTYANALAEDGEDLEDVFLAELKPGVATVTVRAERGGQQIDERTGARYLVLSNGHRYQGDPGQSDYQIVSFGKLRQRLEDGPRRSGGIEEQPSAVLLSRSDTEAVAELHFRVALPLVVLVGGLLALGMARTRPRQGRFARLVPGLGVFVVYYAAIVFSRDALSDGQIPSALGMWPVHGGFALAGIRLLRRSTLPARS